MRREIGDVGLREKLALIANYFRAEKRIEMRAKMPPQQRFVRRYLEDFSQRFGRKRGIVDHQSAVNAGKH